MPDTQPNDALSANDEDKTCLSFGEKFTYAFGQMAVSLSPALISTWLIYYYTGRNDSAGNPILMISAMAILCGTSEMTSCG